MVGAAAAVAAVPMMTLMMMSAAAGVALAGARRASVPELHQRAHCHCCPLRSRHLSSAGILCMLQFERHHSRCDWAGRRSGCEGCATHRAHPSPRAAPPTARNADGRSAAARRSHDARW
uniref:Putative secreted protein n=1 Tax=Anopheles darlingi TaxID=43151 RepID=A0A2M4D232_ANODA